MDNQLKQFLNKINSSYRFTKKMHCEAGRIKELITQINNSSDNLEELLYLINNQLNQPLQCPICNQSRKFLTYKKGYILTCGNKKCIDKLGKIKRDETVLKKYGVENAFQNKQIKEKIKQTNLKKYGVENVNHNKEIRDKIDATNLKKYGVKNVSQNKDIKKKKEETSLKNFGVKYHTELQEEKDKLSKILKNVYSENGDKIIKNRIITNLDKYGVESATQLQETQNKKFETNLDRYGVKNPIQNKDIKEKIKQTNLNRYGVENAMQNATVFDRQQKASYKLKDYIFPSGKIEKIQGYESWTLDLLLKTFDEDDIVINNIKMSRIIGKIDYSLKNKKHIYYPDIYIKSINKIIEVKSEYTYDNQRSKNLAKRQSCLDKGFDFEFYIFNPKGNLLQLNKNLKVINI